MGTTRPFFKIKTPQSGQILLEVLLVFLFVISLSSLALYKTEQIQKKLKEIRFSKDLNTNIKSFK